MSDTAATDSATPSKPATVLEERPLVSTRHAISVDGTPLAYTATCGHLPIKDAQGGIDALLFHTSYTKDDEPDPARRPLCFCFNGGPGSSSVWLHLGAIGPKRAVMNTDGSLPAPPFRLEDNPLTWLDKADLVFIDPVGTGYSHAKDEETAKRFWGVDGDIECLAEFIRLYLVRTNRWASPIFLAGESYGTTRGAGLAGALVEKGIALSGLLLISTVLNFQTLHFTPGNDLPYILFLPTYAATARHHRALAPGLNRRSTASLVREVEAFALGDYATALMQGDRLSPARRRRIAETVARYTGLPLDYVERADLRIDIWKFCKELLRGRGLVVGRLDSRLTGEEGRGTDDSPEADPSMAAIRPPYTSAFNDYVRRQLNFETDRNYEILGGVYAKWDWGKGNQFTDTATALRQALSRNPHLKVFVASGYYDLATPHAACEYTFAHMGLPASLRGNFRIAYYESGHMMYIESGSLAKLRGDVASFIDDTLAHGAANGA
ncbi:MAG: S10 family peptidase [Armatimonadota bacterium]